MEPPGPDLRRRRSAGPDELTHPARLAQVGSAAAAGLLALTSTGDALLLAALLGVAAADPLAAGAGMGAAVALLVRWSTTSLPTFAGIQAAVGPAVVVGPAAAAASSACAAAAFVVVAPTVTTAVPFGLAAGLFVAGPAWASGMDPGTIAARLAAAVAGVVAAVLWARRPRPSRRWRGLAGCALGVAAVVLAVAA